MASKNGYIGHYAVLNDGRGGMIMEGVGTPSSPLHKIKLKSLDGIVFECYHDKIQYVWNH